MSSSRRVLRAPATLEDLLALPDEVAAELVAGELVEKASPTFEHGDAQLQIGTQINGRFGGPPRDGGGGWWFGTEVDVQYDAEVFRHDLVGWRRDRLKGRPTGRPVKVRPDWVCEVLSPSNASTDTVRKLRTLHRFEVPFYWLADPTERTLTVLRWDSAGYVTVQVAEAGERIRAEPFGALELDTARIFGLE